MVKASYPESEALLQDLIPPSSCLPKKPRQRAGIQLQKVAALVDSAQSRSWCTPEPQHGHWQSEALPGQGLEDTAAWLLDRGLVSTALETRSCCLVGGKRHQLEPFAEVAEARTRSGECT